MEALTVKEILDAVDGKLLSSTDTLDLVVTSASTNSNDLEEGALFIPVIGERVDAHNFIEGALANGAVATFTSKDVSVNSKHRAYIRVEHTVEALQKLAAFYRRKFSIPVIGITGSVGKTTTKEMISAALSTKFDVLKTAGNMNSQIGLPLTVLRIMNYHEAAVIEMGMSEEGEMEKLAYMAKPDIAVMTNIGVSHIGQLGSKENIRKEKLNIIDQFDENGLLYVNGDDELLREVIPYQSTLQQKEGAAINIDVTDATRTSLLKSHVCSYGVAPESKYYAKDIVSKEGKTMFTFVYPEGEEEVTLNVLGIHNVMNAVAALAIAMNAGVAPAIAKKGLEAYMPIAMRGGIVETKGVKIIDDTYNASPDSMKSGINVLMELHDVTRRIAVLADVLELGEKSYESHYEVGDYICKLAKEGKHLDQLIVVGKEAKAIAEAVLHSKGKEMVVCANSNEEVIAYLKAMMQPKDAILVKGSRGMHTDEIVKALQ
ncbi:UDP-N-acetylmuramoylalanyl-D-glutamyl-2,6-diaminopimelate--D-alanyl-D-alanine ligase [Lachnospiraceae bacterium KM106-2]|nr:UDP-N-acetylmuramoylalanyl-D-glutamyl-2,6-diaminopimelate--D-alanyl-D-alanine ligase [Lachnospiraceae bacterium KM106-2]